MAYYTVTVAGVDICAEFDAVLSKFEQEPPQAKIVTVDIPAGVDLDITNALGATAFHNGLHRFVFAITGENITERVTALKNAIHGAYRSYVLSWDSGYSYKGRWQVTQIERLSYDAQLVTVEVSHYPFKVRQETVEINSHPVGSYTLEGSLRYGDVTITLRQAATVTIGSTTQQLAAGTHLLASSVEGDTTITVTVDSWYYYIDGTDLIVNPLYYTQSGSDVTFTNPPFSVDGTNIVCDGEQNQISTLTFTRRDI